MDANNSSEGAFAKRPIVIHEVQLPNDKFPDRSLGWGKILSLKACQIVVHANDGAVKVMQENRVPTRPAGDIKDWETSRSLRDL